MLGRNSLVAASPSMSYKFRDFGALSEEQNQMIFYVYERGFCRKPPYGGKNLPLQTARGKS
jgi:hypothetical protein